MAHPDHTLYLKTKKNKNILREVKVVIVFVYLGTIHNLLLIVEFE